MQQQDPGFAGAPPVLPPPNLPDGSAAPPRSAERHANLVKFQSELEFVQCLANPLYLYELHTQKYFADEAFINYLEYLQYWHEPAYVRFITYPTCLVYLSLLLRPAFREAVSNPAYVSELMRVGARHHETWRVEKSASGAQTGSDQAVKLESADGAQQEGAGQVEAQVNGTTMAPAAPNQVMGGAAVKAEVRA